MLGLKHCIHVVLLLGGRRMRRYALCLCILTGLLGSNLEPTLIGDRAVSDDIGDMFETGG